MPDRTRLDLPPDPDGLTPAERDSRIEQLLLTGLDQYFAGQYERAISAWTRVLFLDRGHARAKAYIDRARGAIGERQRETEELLHRGVDAFNRGENEAARQLLTSAVEHGGPQDVALSVLDRLTWLERSGARTGATGRRRRARARPAGQAVAPRERRRRAWLLPAAILGALVLVLFYIQGSRERTAPFLFLLDRGARDANAGARVTEEALLVPRAAEMDLERARVLFSQGHARDALRLVERVGPSDPLRLEAGRLREQIQRALLSEYEGGAAPRSGTPTPTAPAPPVRDQSQ